MLKNKIKLRSLKADDNAGFMLLGTIILGIIFVLVLGSQIINLAVGAIFIAIAVLIIAIAVRMLKKSLSGTKTGGLIKRWI